jgi:ketosteroid isomerase-like protein
VRMVLLASLFVAAALAGCASVPGTERNVADDIVTLTRISEEWDRAIVRKDAAAISKNMAKDFRHIGGDGTVEMRERFLNDLISPEMEIDPYTVEEFDVRVYGDVALLSGLTRMTGRFAGQPFQSHYRYIDVYVRRNGEWKVVSVQISWIPK